MTHQGDAADRPLVVGVVDDHAMFAAGVAAWLTSRLPGTVTFTAGSWPELLGHPLFPPTVVLLDLDLADHVPARVKITAAAAAGSAVVVVSASAVGQVVRGCLRAGALGYVPKTQMADELVEAVEHAVRGEVFLSPALAAVLEAAPDAPVLSDQEARVLALYAAGLPLKSVARQLNIGYESAKTYLDRVKEKYALFGRDARTKIDLRQRAAEDGYLTTET